MSGLPKCILLDIEGTTSSISFVYDVMFPYVRQHLVAFLDRNWDTEPVIACLPLLASEMGQESVQTWLGSDSVVARKQVSDGVIELMDQDVKATGLKKLQGAIWKEGFESRQLVAHLFDDVAGAIDCWKETGIEVRIYSSGSVQAQKLFFGHTVEGNLLPQITAHYDTTIGSKKEAGSYVSIADDAQLETQDIVFISDVAAELDAARQAGMQTILSLRPGNKPVNNRADYYSIESFNEIDFSRVCV